MTDNNNHKIDLYIDCPYCLESGHLSTYGYGLWWGQSCGNCENRWGDDEMPINCYGARSKIMTVDQWNKEVKQ